MSPWFRGGMLAEVPPRRRPPRGPPTALRPSPSGQRPGARRGRLPGPPWGEARCTGVELASTSCKDISHWRRLLFVVDTEHQCKHERHHKDFVSLLLRLVLRWLLRLAWFLWRKCRGISCLRVNRSTWQRVQRHVDVDVDIDVDVDVDIYIKSSTRHTA